MGGHTVGRRQVRKLRKSMDCALLGKNRRDAAADKRYQQRRALRLGDPYGQV